MRFFCVPVLGIDIQDEMGRHEVGNFENMKKLKLGPDGRGCRLEASFKINKVSGNFHVSTHARSQQAGKNVNFKHQLHNLIFGESILSNVRFYLIFVEPKLSRFDGNLLFIT